MIFLFLVYRLLVCEHDSSFCATSAPLVFITLPLVFFLSFFLLVSVSLSTSLSHSISFLIFIIFHFASSLLPSLNSFLFFRHQTGRRRYREETSSLPCQLCSGVTQSTSIFSFLHFVRSCQCEVRYQPSIRYARQCGKKK